MATYYQELTMSSNATPGLTFRLKVVETVNPASNNSTVAIILQYKNTSGEPIYSKRGEYFIKLNGETVLDQAVTQSFRDTSGEYNDCSSNVLNGRLSSYSVNHNTSGGGSLTVYIQVKMDAVSNIYLTTGTATISESLTDIDTSAPSVTNLSISADRYGLNASVSFKAIHSSYALSKVRFEFKCLTKAQADNRVGKSTQADSSRRVYDEGRKAYTLILEKTKNLSKTNSITFDLDSIDEKSYPLTSGGSYEYGLIITCPNGKSYTKTGTLNVPQKVTGVTCSTPINLVQGESAQISYTVLPTNAQLQTVTFTSSDPSVVSVNSSGVVTAKTSSQIYSSAKITIKTDDGSYTTTCTVNVSTAEEFVCPPLVERYLTAEHLNSIIKAATVLRTRLINLGGSVDSFSGTTVSGRSENILNLKKIFTNVQNDFKKLQDGARNYGVPDGGFVFTDKIPEMSAMLIYLLDNCVYYLQHLNSYIN